MSWTTSGTSTTANDSTFVFGNIQRSYIRFGPPPAPPPVAKPVMHPCAVLGIPCGAPPGQVRSAYRRLAKENHPDLCPPEEREGRTRRMVELNTAYAMLEGRAKP